MSMNVGDSSDLIHGGSGGLGVFWRSRTEFEKKLLVILVVMTLVIISLIVAVAVVGAQNAQSSKQEGQYTTPEPTKAAISTTPVTLSIEFKPGMEQEGLKHQETSSHNVAEQNHHATFLIYSSSAYTEAPPETTALLSAADPETESAPPSQKDIIPILHPAPV